MKKLAKKNLIANGSESLHILFVSAYWHYPEVMLEFVEKVRKRGHKVSVFLGDFPRRLDCQYLDGDVDFYFPSKCEALSVITRTPYPILKDVKTFLRQLRPDVVHINSHLFLSNYQVARAARSLRIPFVVTVHGFAVRRGLIVEILQEVYLRTIAKRLFNMSSQVICLTEAEAENVAEVMGGYDKISVIPNGVDVDFFKPSIEKDSNLVAWVGRFVPEKGLIYLLEAMREVVKQHADVKLVLGGDGPLRNDLQDFVNKFGLGKNVIFLGVLNHKEVARILSKSILFVFPSLKEGMPRALLESMACGIAVIGSNVSGIKDIITHEHDGILVTPRDQVVLANTILTLLDDENLRQFIGQNARQLMVENYNWNNIICKIEKIYYDSVGKKKENIRTARLTK
jgi:glycosyltransferase involved in cell wall biosynthesis